MLRSVQYNIHLIQQFLLTSPQLDDIRPSS